MTNSSIYSILNVTIHPDYVPKNCDNDIAVIKLDREIELSQSIEIICMPTSEVTLKIGDNATAIGWFFFNFLNLL